MPQVVIVPSREPRQLDLLGMRCDSRQIPALIDPKGAVVTWLCESGSFGGKAARFADDGTFTSAEEGGANGTVAAVTDDYCLAAILDASDGPAVWIYADLGDLTIKTEGEQGIFKKRPKMVEAHCGDDFELLLARVAKVLPSGRAQVNQENALLTALGG